MTKIDKAIWKIKSIFFRAYIKINENTFGSGYQRIKYLLRNKRNNELVVVFSGFQPVGTKPIFNMVRTLWSVKKNQLFILDDFGYNNRGAVYLGENGDFFLIPQIVKLIEVIIKENNINKLYCVGSSKGGWAALYYGLVCNADLIIAGAPQYYYGNYLSENEEHLKILNSIMGDTSDQSISYLNDFLRKEIFSHKSAQKKPKIVVHYSKNEHTYNEHISFLLEDLRKLKYYVEEDIEEYLEHSQVSDYFPTFLITRLIKG
ncbi:Two component regulator three Y domain-containing protein [Chloroflexota bacterium]